MIELLPCPYCGSTKVELTIGRSHQTDAVLAMIRCSECGAQVQAASGPEDLARETVAARWNRRTGVHDGHCTTCGSEVEVVSTDEGTSYYRPRGGDE